MTVRQSHGITMQDLLRKYEMTEPVPQNVQEDMLKRKAGLFKKIIGTAGGISILYGLRLSLYFWIKKSGIGFAITKIFISCVAAALIGTGVYVAIRPVHPEKKSTPAIETAAATQARTTGEQARQLDHQSANGGCFGCTVGIYPAKSGSVKDPLILSRLSKNIGAAIREARGEKFVAYLPAGAHPNMPYGLYTSIESLEGIILVTAKVVEVKTLNVVTILDERITSFQEIDAAGARIGRKIAESIKY